MTRDEAKKLAPLIQAYAEGSSIQVFNAANEWADLSTPEFQPHNTYRIKPEARRFWINVYPKDKGISVVHDSKEAADSGKMLDLIESIEVIEVLK